MDIRALDNCPIAIQSNAVNIKHHLATIEGFGLGPANPIEPNEEFWAEKAVIWGIGPGEARGRTCSNCEHYYDNQFIRDCIMNGPAKDLKASTLPLTPKWADIEEHPVGFCEKFDITCSPIRTCDEQEIRTRYENPEPDSKSNSEKIDSYELQSFEVNSGDSYE
jgi:hypothetical protein